METEGRCRQRFCHHCETVPFASGSAYLEAAKRGALWLWNPSPIILKKLGEMELEIVRDGAPRALKSI